MASDPHIPDPRHPRVHDRGRGPEVVGTRLLVVSVLQFLDAGHSTQEMAASFGVCEQDVRAAEAFIGDHRGEIGAELSRREAVAEGRTAADLSVGAVRDRLAARAAELRPAEATAGG